MAEVFAPLTLASLSNQTSAINVINTNFSTLATILSDVLSRSGVTPNQMLANLDMNSNRILNLPTPINLSDPVRLQDVASPTTINILTNGVSLASSVQGSLPYATAPNTWTSLQPGTLGFLLQTGGPGANPSWVGFQPSGTGAVTRTWNSKIQDYYVSVIDFGAVPDGVTDCRAAIQAAVNAVGATTFGGVVYFPPGKYKILGTNNISLTMPNSIFSLSIVGSGIDSSIVNFTNGGFNFTYGGTGQAQQTSVNMRDLTITTSALGGPTAVILQAPSGNPTPGNGPMSNIVRVAIRGDDAWSTGTMYWSGGVGITNVSNVNFEGCFFSGQGNQYNATPSFVGSAISISGLNSGGGFYAVGFNIHNCSFIYFTEGLFIGNYVQGVTVNQSNFSSVYYAVFTPVGALGAITQLCISDSQFAGGAPGNQISLNLNTGFGNTMITNNLFLISSPGDTAINLNQTAHYQITNNQFQGAQTATGQIGIAVGTPVGGAGGNISHNDFFSIGGSGSMAINLSPGSLNSIIQGNSFTSNNININAFGTGHRINDNIGFNPIGDFVITPSASPFTYTSGFSRETVYVSGGTVSAVGRGFAFGPTSGAFDLGPNETLTVTYTSVPTMSRTAH